MRTRKGWSCLLVAVIEQVPDVLQADHANMRTNIAESCERGTDPAKGKGHTWEVLPGLTLIKVCQRWMEGGFQDPS